jgi:proteasome assembly chaperone (PAC2) family protein
MERPKFNESAPMDTLEQFSTNEQVIGDITKAEFEEKMKIVRWEVMKGATIGIFGAVGLMVQLMERMQWLPWD